MAQYAVYRNPNPRTRAKLPYLLDIQSDLLSDLDTRVVVPLARRDRVGAVIDELHPCFEVEGIEVVARTAQLAGIPVALLGGYVTNLAEARATILAATDLLLTGI